MPRRKSSIRRARESGLVVVETYRCPKCGDEYASPVHLIDSLHVCPKAPVGAKVVARKLVRT